MRAQAITRSVPASVENAPEWIAPLLVELGRSGVDPERWLRATLRLVPSVILVPAFGLRALPFPAQLLFAFVFSGATLPAVAGGLPPLARPWVYAVLEELAAGLPVAVSAAAGIWGATMAGNLLDELRGGPAPSDFPLADSPVGPLGILLSLAASISFLEFGGPAQLAQTLVSTPHVTAGVLAEVVHSLIAGVQLAVLIAAPLLVVLLFLEVFHALLTRATRSGLWLSLIAPLRALSVLAIVALLLDRLVEGLALWMHSVLRS
ncbi:MAG: flagellar biosynthetic protein FliR [Deltaproteobacteria bacterium]